MADNFEYRIRRIEQAIHDIATGQHGGSEAVQQIVSEVESHPSTVRLGDCLRISMRHPGGTDG